MPVENSLDNVGPMTRTVADNALLLGVIAGPDGLDPRQGPLRPAEDYMAALGRGVVGLRIGVLAEGFGLSPSGGAVDRLVRLAAKRFAGLGAVVEDVSVPMHPFGSALWLAIAAEGATEIMMSGNAFGAGWRGLYVTSLRKAHRSWRERTGELSDTLKVVMLLGSYMKRETGGALYAKAQNVSRRLRAAYDEALSRHDLLLMPTAPDTAPPLPPADATRAFIVQSAIGSLPNTSPFNVSGHPAMSVPCGMIDGLPAGMMLVGKYYDEVTIYRAAAAFEASA